MYLGWLSYGGTEIINSSRTLQYAERFGIYLGCQDSCPDLNVVLGDESYQTGFDVPWDDVTQPSGFLGFVGQSITGMENGTLRNIVTDLPGDGSSIGLQRRSRRELLIQVLAVGANRAALDYGIAWLNSALRGAVCDATSSCTGATLCFYDECPDCTGQTADECNTEHLKNLFHVGVLEPPTVVSRITLNGVCEGSNEPAAGAVLEFTLVAGIPHIYSQPQLLANVDGADWVPNQGWYPDSVIDCPPAIDCAVDPNCPEVSAPPEIPVPLAACVEHLPGLYDTAWVSVSGATLSDWFEKVPYIEIYSGSTEMRSIAVRFANNPAGVACNNTNMGSCRICVTAFIPYIPAGSTVVIDGRVERATVTCPQSGLGTLTGVTNTNPVIVYGQEGEIYDWPTLECGESWCVNVQAHADYRADDATVNVSLVERRDSA